ncbi:MAG: DUF222 domain-containing protein [Micrococcaceae bacterium]|nr:DUF222 domain-containing protein [Micrococcaceae bacterium]
MQDTSSIIDPVLAAIGMAVGTGAGGAPENTTTVDPLRLLAALSLVSRRALDAAAASVDSSPVRAAMFTLLCEKASYAGAYAQILAAGTCVDAEVHTLTDVPLAAVNRMVRDLEPFATGSATLPCDVLTGPDRKALHKDPAEFLKSQLHLGHFAARHRINTHQRLMEHHGADGCTLPPTFPRLAQVLAGGKADPRLVANSAAKLLSLQPVLDVQPDPQLAADRLERQLARTLDTVDNAGVGRFMKQAAIALENTSVERDEAATARYLGLRYKGRKPTGYLWELTTDVEGHELLTTLADDLNNPRTGSGSPGKPDSGSTRGLPDSLPAVIPAWAIDPGIPMPDRPRAQFSDLGKPTAVLQGRYGDIESLPGETEDQANARHRAQRLAQALMDALRTWMDPASPPDTSMPMKSHIELLVMIDYGSLTGALEKPGLTPHGEYISAAAARQMACNAGMLPLVMGARSQPLDLGERRRFFSKGQKRAIAARDRGCTNPGCSMPTHRCEVHHIQPFSEGGKTDVSNGALLCIRCHTSFHAGHFTFAVIQDIPHVVQPTSRDPYQIPTRNTFFHPEIATN